MPETIKPWPNFNSFILLKLLLLLASQPLTKSHDPSPYTPSAALIQVTTALVSLLWPQIRVCFSLSLSICVCFECLIDYKQLLFLLQCFLSLAFLIFGAFLLRLSKHVEVLRYQISCVSIDKIQKAIKQQIRKQDY